MLEKTLHAGNIAASVAIVATAADLTLAGGTGTAIGATLSGLALFKKAPKEQKSIAQAIAQDFGPWLDGSHLTPDRKKVAIQILTKFPPSETDLAQGSMNAGKVAQMLRGRVAKTAQDSAYKTETALDDFQKALTALLAPALRPTNTTEAILQELLARTETSGEAQRLRDAGITEKAIIELAGRNASETEDLGQAWRELQNAMEIALQVQQEGRTPSNHGAFVDEVLRRVAERSAEGDYKAALGEIDDALEKQAAETARLLDSGVEVALLAGDAQNAADLLIRKADHEAGGRADFKALRRIYIDRWTTGLAKGLAQPIDVAIALARELISRAADAHQRGMAHHDLGTALVVMGARDRENDRLEQAVAAFREALTDRKRKRVPVQWAMTKNSLGIALLRLGERDAGSKRLKKAISAFRAALKVRDSDEYPREWAASQNNLGFALSILGERKNDTERLEEAVAAFGAALGKRSPTDEPLEWAETKMNFSRAFVRLFDQTRDPAKLDVAQRHAEEAREIYALARAEASLEAAQTLLADIAQRRG